MICPICKHDKLQPSDAFCPRCGYEIHIIPAGASEAVKNFESERAKKYDKTWKALEQISKMEYENSQLRIQIQEKQIALNDSQDTIEKIKKQRNEIQATLEPPMAFLVMTQGDNVTAIYSIFEGENSFGYTNSHDRHQQIICQAQVADVHFIINALSSIDSKGRRRTKFFVAPKDGQIFGSSNKANIISSERELEKNESVFIENVRFTLVANKT